MNPSDKPRRWLPIRFLAATMEAMKRAADQTTRVPGQGTPGYPDWPEVRPIAPDIDDTASPVGPGGSRSAEPSADPTVGALGSTSDAQDDDEARVVIDDVDHP